MNLFYRKLRHYLKKKINIPRNLADVRRLNVAGIPGNLIPAFRYLATGHIPDTLGKEQVEQVEAIRNRLAERKGEVSIYYSPKPLSAGSDYSGDIRPEPGEVKKFPLRHIATKTSIARDWGVFLYLLSRYSGARTILELGACAGISGCYLSSPDTCNRFYTVEASGDLAVLAQENLSMINKKGRVIQDLFDNALDDLEDELKREGLDMVWIDGHHEKVATLHYFKRVIPFLNAGAVVLFDDIYWSRDMHEAWEILSGWKGFSHTIDLKRKKGMGIWSGHPETIPGRLEFNVHNQRIAFNEPHGWE